MRAPVAVLGGSGQVGQEAARILRRLGVDALRLGGRGGTRLRRAAQDVGAQAMPADVQDPESLRAFCAGTALVLNCAGPSYLHTDRVARAALHAGVPYVDVSGDGPAHRLLAGSVPTGGLVVLSAGMLPGLANAVPRLLARGRGGRLLVHSGGIELFSPAAAADLVLSLDAGDADDHWYGEPLAAWRHGRRVARALPVRDDVELPYFPGRVSVLPFLSADCERVALTLGLAELDWFNVFTGGQLRLVLGRLRGRVPRDQTGLDAAAARVCEAARLDLGGGRPYYAMVFTLAQGRTSRTALLRTASSFRLTAAVGAATARAVLDGSVAPGLHFADDVLDPAWLLEQVRELGTLPAFDIHEGDPALTRSGEHREEGVL